MTPLYCFIATSFPELLVKPNHITPVYGYRWPQEACQRETLINSALPARAMDGLPKSGAIALDFVSRNKTALLFLHPDFWQEANKSALS
jgi:hypothetical protein